MVRISATAIDNYLWAVYDKIYNYVGDSRTADNMVYPLRWYVNTGRASTYFLNAMLNAKPFMIARKLRDNYTTDDNAIKAVIKYLGV